MDDPLVLVGPGVPPEWRLPADVAAHFPPGKFIFTKSELALRETILRSRWFLVRNEHGGRCPRCGRQHTYLTHLCVERPFNALSDIMLRHVDDVTERGHVHGARIVERYVRVKAVEAGPRVPISAEDALRLKRRIIEAEVRGDVLAALGRT